MERPYSASNFAFHAGSVYADSIQLERPARGRAERRYRARGRKARQQVARDRLHALRRGGRISPAFLDVGLALVDFAGLEDGCFPSYVTLARRSGRHVDTVQVALKALAGFGVLAWIRRKVARRSGRVQQTSNLYALRVDILLRAYVDRDADPFAELNKTLESLESVSTRIDRPVTPLPDVSLKGDTLKRARALAGIVLPRSREGPHE